MLIAIRDHRTTPVPPLSSHNMDFLGHEGIGGSNDRTDIEVVLEVFDGDMKWIALTIKICHHRIQSPVAIPIHHVSAIALGQ